MRLSIWSFMRMFEMWFLTVFGLMWSSAAMTRVVLAVRDQLQHLDLAFGELGANQLLDLRLGARGADALQHFAAMCGEMSASPRAAALIPATSSWIDASLRR